MDMTTIILGGALILFLVFFIFGITYTIVTNLINGRKFHYSLEQDFNKLRLGKMLSALGLNKTEYIYRTNVADIRQQMARCSDCTNTAECDDNLSTPDIDIADIEFCNNEEKLRELKQRQATNTAEKSE